MIRARVIAGFGVSNAYVEYTIERAGPPPKVTHCSHASVACVHGATDAAPAVLQEIEAERRTAAEAESSGIRIIRAG
jgi:hypothetical protein